MYEGDKADWKELARAESAEDGDLEGWKGLAWAESGEDDFDLPLPLSSFLAALIKSLAEGGGGLVSFLTIPEI